MSTPICLGMALTVKVSWDKAIVLGPKSALQRNLVALIDDLPNEPGIYVFGRRFGKAIVPMYIGKARNGLRGRLKQQANNLKLMTALASEKNGVRVLMLGLVKPAQKQQLDQILDVAERAYIEHALTDGCQLINIQGTKTKLHEVAIAGAKSHSNPFPKAVYLPVKG